MTGKYADASERFADVVLMAQSMASLERRSPNEGDVAAAFTMTYTGPVAREKGRMQGALVRSSKDPVAAYGVCVEALYDDFAHDLTAAAGLVLLLAQTLADRADVPVSQVLAECIDGARAAGDGNG